CMNLMDLLFEIIKTSGIDYKIRFVILIIKEASRKIAKLYIAFLFIFIS
ncbi:MAG: hypothetical protein JWQ57_694, partial [Mucilaginibacter sp.]|nr:hypothetical protein [Mucilaginibacter sp.]